MKSNAILKSVSRLLIDNLSCPLADECLKAMEAADGVVDCREQGLSGMTYFIARLKRPGAVGIEELYEGLVRAPAGVPIVTCRVGETGRSFVIFTDSAFGDLYGIVREGRPLEVKPIPITLGQTKGASTERVRNTAIHLRHTAIH